MVAADPDSPAAEGGSRTLALAQALMAWARRVGLLRKAAVACGIAALLAGVATYFVLSGTAPAVPDPDLLRLLLLLDFFLLLILVAFVATRLVRLWSERRANAAGSRLHARIVGLFTFVTVTPTIVIAVFSAIFFDRGLQSWFSDQVRTAVQQSNVVAEAYIAEHRRTITADVLAMATDLNRAVSVYARDPQLFSALVGTQARVRALPEAMVVDRGGNILARSGLAFLMEFERVPDWAFDRAQTGEVVVLTSGSDDRVRALVRLDSVVGAYLYVGRFIDSRVLDHVERVRLAASGYQRLAAARSGIEITFAMVFVLVSVLLLLASVTFGLAIATRLATPIIQLINAAQRVGSGDLSARVRDSEGNDELARLSRAFNRMTGQIETQRDALVSANAQIDERRRFTEAVLSGVSAGVIGVDADGRIELVNPSACRMLALSADAVTGRMLDEAVPEFTELAEMAYAAGGGRQAQVNVVRDGATRNLVVNATMERGEATTAGIVFTFDDMTQLVAAQRQAAWADVARRIAHEIKNPLTPIQLSAERLKRKYAKEISSDPEVFHRCTETIIRQVGDIGRMVDEFSAFARMPAPSFAPENLLDLVRQGVFPQQMALPEIAYRIEAPDEPLVVRCDRRQIAQVLTNLLKNAAEAIDARRERDPDAPKGEIRLRLSRDGARAVVEIIDNGKGLPVEDRHRLTEPYVTTRTKGTGLGLAIVKKIVEEHAGQISLGDAEGGGAVVRFTLPLVADATTAPERGGETAVAQDKVA
ncbi:sensor histidine kinase NtrY-like [Desertibaculum subflavum]|uniref:sensor histidine kinase NtrY-like n=1 Tax=Desertibaculum subflavum TaxID=2268458 RepID=UPI000E66237B